MAKILARVQRQENESVIDFKNRCCDAMTAAEAPPWSVAIGRFSVLRPGVLNNVGSTHWGQAWPDLPANECFIAAISKAEAPDNELVFDERDLDTAPLLTGCTRSRATKSLGM
jgi:hypothetical protein